MRITEAPTNILAAPSKAPIIQPGQWATNGIGWSVETLTPNGWKPCGTAEEPIIFDDRERAEAWTAAFRELCPTREFRTAEALEGWL
jgi:hypothetical protein